ncbi:MAG: tRNA (adenosine(37)-N6)-threonylcarbamoyltransferase complex dimerization subunit type 1 TsaB [Geminicoccaceae bacterium]
MILLALESAASVCSVAVCDEAGQMLGYRRGEPGTAQADRLVALIDAALHAAGVSYQDLDVLAVNRGPGSFTGIRAGVAAARALALALARPVIAVNTLEALAAAAGAQPAGTIIAAVDARRSQLYVQAFDQALVALGPPRVLAPADLRLGAVAPPLRLVGNGAVALAAVLSDAGPMVSENIEADAGGVARRAQGRLAAGERPLEGRAVQPLYLRPPDARLPTLPRAPASVAVGAAACSR